jgi:hypothetical protein
MKIENNTKFPTELARKLIEFARPSGISKFQVRIRNTGYSYKGRAYTFRNRIDIFYNHKNKYPRYYHPYQLCGQKGKKHWVANATELMLWIFAHELRHLWQAKQKNKRGYAWGSRGKFSEVDTEAYSLRKIREFRKQGLTI